jgi:hypothetical protein
VKDLQCSIKWTHANCGERKKDINKKEGTERKEEKKKEVRMEW